MAQAGQKDGAPCDKDMEDMVGALARTVDPIKSFRRAHSCTNNGTIVIEGPTWSIEPIITWFRKSAMDGIAHVLFLAFKLAPHHEPL